MDRIRGNRRRGADGRRQRRIDRPGRAGRVLDRRPQRGQRAGARGDAHGLAAGRVEPISVQTSQGTCALGDTVTCAFGTLEPNGGYASVYIETRTRVEGRWENTASIESETEDPNPANDRATVVIDVTGPVPRVSEVAMTRSVFRVGTRSAIAFVMSSPATVTLRVERRIRGRGWMRASAPFIRRAAEGENLVAFSGRVRRNGRLRALRPGVYRAQLTAVDRLGGRSIPRAVRFRVVR